MRVPPPDVPQSGTSFLMKGHAGLAGRLVLSWALSGGLSMVAVLVLAAYLSGSPQAASVPFTVTLYFLLGACGGLLHGALLGATGRPEAVSLPQAARAIEVGAAWALPGLAAAWICGLWISMTPVAVSVRSARIVAMVAGGWLVFGAILTWAAVEARYGLRHAMKRWPERRPGVALVLLTFVTLMIVFVLQKPEIWFTDLQVSAVGAVLLALGATVWIALPVLVFVLHFLHQWLADSPVWEGSHHLQGHDPR